MVLQTRAETPKRMKEEEGSEEHDAESWFGLQKQYCLTKEKEKGSEKTDLFQVDRGGEQQAGGVVCQRKVSD